MITIARDTGRSWARYERGFVDNGLNIIEKRGIRSFHKRILTEKEKREEYCKAIATTSLHALLNSRLLYDLFRITLKPSECPATLT